MDKAMIKVLIADDSKSIRNLLVDIIQHYFPCKEVIAVQDGSSAWGMVVGGGFDLVISDWNMPNLNGYELLKNIRTDERFEKMPFLMLTARGDQQSVISAIKGGVNDYVVKPFDENIIISKVEKLTGLKAEDQSAQKESPEAAPPEEAAQ